MYIIENLLYLQFSNKSVSADNIECCNTKNSVRIVDSGFLEYFTGNWNSAVNLLMATQTIKATQKTDLVLILEVIWHTGLAIIPIRALGQTSATATAKSRTMDALILKRSSLVMPGLRGTPAGIMTTSQPSRELCHYKRIVSKFLSYCFCFLYL